MNPILESLYHHPNNGEGGVFLAAFVSADRTYPIFVHWVDKRGDRYIAECEAPKWGYDSDDKMNFCWYSDEQLLRETSERLYTVAQINNYRWRPANASLTVPAELAARFRLQPLQIYMIHNYVYDEHVVVTCIDRNHGWEQISRMWDWNRDDCSFTAIELDKPDVYVF